VFAARPWREVLILSIEGASEGTEEVHTLVIGEQLTGLKAFT
jgi:hypothetical protein